MVMDNTGGDKGAEDGDGRTVEKDPGGKDGEESLGVACVVDNLGHEHEHYRNDQQKEQREPRATATIA